MKYAIIILLFLVLCSCRAKYEVIQEILPGQYHLQGVKNMEVLVVNTTVILKEGDIVTLKYIEKNHGITK